MLRKHVIFTILLGCSLSLSHSFAKESKIFGADDRQKIPTPSGPLASIGRLKTSNGTYADACTATLVARDLVLTNLHCVGTVAGAADQAHRISFQAGFGNGHSVASSIGVEVIGRFTRTERGISYERYAGDWAIVRLKDPIGEQVGWFDVAETSPTAVTAVSLAGYSGDIESGEVMTRHAACSLRGKHVAIPVISHDCDMTSGASGSPLFRLRDGGQRPQIVALNAGDLHDPTAAPLIPPAPTEYSDYYSNYGIDTKNFYATLNAEIAKSEVRARGRAGSMTPAVPAASQILEEPRMVAPRAAVLTAITSLQELSSSPRSDRVTTARSTAKRVSGAASSTQPWSERLSRVSKGN